MEQLPHLVIVGGGFGGLNAARSLSRLPVRITLLDRRNFHLFQPLLYQVATGALSPANIAAPLRSLLRKHRNVTVLLGEVIDLDPAGRRVLLRDGSAVSYDYLVLATGARHHYFGHPQWEAQAPGLKTIEDATLIRRRVLLAFEQAEKESDPVRARALLTFVVVGGGPTGVELAGALAEVAHKTLRHDFRNIDPRSARILLLEAGARILATYPERLSQKAADGLTEMGVEVRTNTAVIDIQPGVVTVRTGESSETLPCHTILWGAGVQASALGQMLARHTGAALDRAGRVIVGPDLSVPQQREIFVIGDLAHLAEEGKPPLPGVAPVAMQQGAHLARVIQARLEGHEGPPFRYRDRGSMATISVARAVADLGWIRFSGYLAWLAWLFLHLLYLVEFQNRLLVLFQWAWNYLTRNRAARLITGVNDEAPLP